MARVALLLLGVGLCLVSTTHGWRYGRSSTCAYLYTRGDNSGDNLKITKGTKEDGKDTTGMARNYIRYSKTKSVKVKEGCTLELFGEEGFKKPLGSIKGPSRGLYNQVFDSDFKKYSSDGSLKGWKCLC